MRVPDIELTEHETELLAQVNFRSTRHEDYKASVAPMTALVESLRTRGGIPQVRVLYFTDPDRNPGGRGRSRQEIFEKNGTAGTEIFAHPHFMKFLEYFIFGPNLPSHIVFRFKDAMSCSGYLTGSDVLELIPFARSFVRSSRLEPHDIADEFHKLVLECAASPSSAETIRRQIRSVRLT